MIALQGVSKVYRGFWGRKKVQAVSGLSLEIGAGQIFGLLGPNGSGKTTTIQMLLGLLRPSSGTISVLGSPPGHLGTRRRIGYLPEEFDGGGFLSAEESLLFHGGFFGLGKTELRRRAEALLRDLDLWDDRKRRLREYSKGMRRRIGLAQSLLHEPDLVILDEPTNGLDPLGIRKVKSLLLGLRDRGRTVLVSSHILPEMEDICDRVMILEKGRSLVTGRLEDLLRRAGRSLIEVGGDVPPDPEELGALLSTKGMRLEGVRADRDTLEELFLRVVEGLKDPL